MEKRSGVRPAGQAGQGADAAKGRQSSDSRDREGGGRQRKMTEYGTQLAEKQKVKEMYGMREKQFRRFFALATRSKEAAGDKLLSLLERRLDNVVYRLKLAGSREQARQIIVHGHVCVNGGKVSSPSYLVQVNDEIALASRSAERSTFMEFVVAKRMKKAVRPPEWLETSGEGLRGKVVRLPARADVKTPIEEHHIIELYSK